jgi:hypothetical protein
MNTGESGQQVIQKIAQALGGGMVDERCTRDQVFGDECGFSVVVLLCHNLLGWLRRRWQQGQRDSLRARPRAMVMRMVVMEVCTWRSGRTGRSARSETFG